MFSAIAPVYDLILGSTLTRLYRNAIEQTIAVIPSLNPNDRSALGSQESLNMIALDVGAGTLQLYATRGPI